MDLASILKGIPQTRLLIYLLAACCFPLLLIGMWLFSSLESLNQLEASLQSHQAQALQKARKQSANLALANVYQKVDHFYIDKNLEKLVFLESEIESLKKISENVHFADNELVRKRLEFLTSPQNHLSFSESAVQSTPKFQEVVELQSHPVEVNMADLKRILSLIEGVEFSDAKPVADRPQLILLEFKLDKKSSSDKNEIFNLNMKLLKREFQ